MQFVPDQHKIKEMCDKVILENGKMLGLWIVSDCYKDQNCVINYDIVTLVTNGIVLNSINLNNINLDDVNFDNYDPETINHISLIAWYNRYKQCKAYEKKDNQNINACSMVSNKMD